MKIANYTRPNEQTISNERQQARHCDRAVPGQKSGLRNCPAKERDENHSNEEATQQSHKTRLERTTMVEAKVDVGFGNSLFIRGQGAELSWDKGLPLNCIDGSTWVWSTTKAKDKLVFKLVLNDQVWAQGEKLWLSLAKRLRSCLGFSAVDLPNVCLPRAERCAI